MKHLVVSVAVIILSCWTIQSFAQKSIEVSNNIKLEYVEQGNANDLPVIFLHGIGDSWCSFESVFAHLPKHIRAFAISQRGHGDSDRPLSGFSMTDFANDVASFVNKKNLARVIVVGHSMGGMVAQRFAILYPQLVKAVVLIDSDATFGDNPGMPEFHTEVLNLKGQINKKFMDDFQRSTLSKPIDAAYYDKLVAEGLKLPVKVFQSAFTGMMAEDISRELNKIEVPVLIFWGDQDSICGRKDQEALDTNIKNSRLIIYEGIGHALHWQEPARFVQDFLEFVDGLAEN